MKTFKIEISETLLRDVEVIAETRYQALKIIEKKYKDEDIVLDYSDFQHVFFSFSQEKHRKIERELLTNELIDYCYDEEKRHWEELENPDNHIFVKIQKLKNL